MNTRMISTAVVVGLSVGLSTGCSSNDRDDRRAPVHDNSMYSGIPSNAVRAASGYGTVRYRANSSARVIIGDDSKRSVITETSVNSGDEVVVNAEGDSVTVNGRVVYNQNLQKHDQHSIYVVSR